MISRGPDNARRCLTAICGATERRRSCCGPGRMGYIPLPRGRIAASDIVYDREGSSFALADPGDYDWDAASGASIAPSSGITPALGKRARPPRRRGSGGAQQGIRSRSTAITASRCGAARRGPRSSSPAGWRGGNIFRQSSRHSRGWAGTLTATDGPPARGGGGGIQAFPDRADDRVHRAPRPRCHTNRSPARIDTREGAANRGDHHRGIVDRIGAGTHRRRTSSTASGSAGTSTDRPCRACSRLLKHSLRAIRAVRRSRIEAFIAESATSGADMLSRVLPRRRGRGGRGATFAVRSRPWPKPGRPIRGRMEMASRSFAASVTGPRDVSWRLSPAAPFGGTGCARFCPRPPAGSVLSPGQRGLLLPQVWTPSPRLGPTGVMVYLHGGAYRRQRVTRCSTGGTWPRRRRGRRHRPAPAHAFGYLYLARLDRASGQRQCRPARSDSRLALVRDNIAAFGGDPAGSWSSASRAAARRSPP